MNTGVYIDTLPAIKLLNSANYYEMDKNNFLDKATLEIIPKIILIFTSLLVTLGVISSVIYYKSFSINILEYITIGEALILFISKFTIFAIPLTFGLFVGLLLYDNKANVENPEIIKSIKPTLKQELFAYLIIVPLFVLSFLGFSPFVIWTIPLAFIVRLYVLHYIIKNAKLYFKYKNLNSNIVKFIHIAGIAIIFVAGIAMTQANLVYSGRSGKKVTLHYSNGKIKESDSLNLYLGKTQSFYYLYDKLNDKATIIKGSQIDKMEIELKQK